MKRVFVLLSVLIIFIVSLVVGGEFKRHVLIYEDYVWRDAEGLYVTADSIEFDGSGVDSSVLGTEDVYAGTSDSVVRIVVIAKGEADSTTADTIAYGIAGGSDPSAVVDTLLTDTTIIPSDGDDSILIAATVYVQFHDSVGYETGDELYVRLYALNDRDTIWGDDYSFPSVENKKVLFYWRAAASAAATNDSVLVGIQNRWGPIDVWRTVQIDSMAGSTLKDSGAVILDNSDSTFYGWDWRAFAIIAGQDVDTTTYKIWVTLSEYTE